MIIGNSWKMFEPLTSIGFFAPNKIPSSRKDELLQSLLLEKDFVPVATDTYFFGKQVAKMARLALIAEELEQYPIQKEIILNMERVLSVWFDGNNSTMKLVYDSTLGGVVSVESLKDAGAVFGSGKYNDHHYHFGYFLYAAAVIARSDISWWQQYGEKVTELARDIANPSQLDGYFTTFRHKDWYTMHSWASGLFEFGDAKNQESTSEAVNAYYSLYLLGVATNNDNMKNIGRILLATEIHAAKKYWQIKSNSTIYDPLFSNNKVVGILWETKVDYATWFGLNIEYIHCIQMLPFTPISEELLDISWIKEEYSVLVKALQRTSPPLEDGWRGFIYLAHSIIDPNSAYKELSSVKQFDDGNSKTNSLYFIFTRPNFRV